MIVFTLLCPFVSDIEMIYFFKFFWALNFMTLFLLAVIAEQTDFWNKNVSKKSSFLPCLFKLILIYFDVNKNQNVICQLDNMLLVFLKLEKNAHLIKQNVGQKTSKFYYS